jgi:hypothetical protein
MAEDSDIKRFIEAIKTEADKQEDFVLERVEENYPTLWNLMQSRYDNFEDLCTKALKKSSIYGKMEELVKRVDYQQRDLMIRETLKRRGERMATIASWTDKELYDKFCWRYGRDDIKKIAVETADKEKIVESDKVLL